MIKDIDELQLKLLDLSDVDRLERHAHVEMAFSELTDKNNMLEKALKQSQLENAGIRNQLEVLLREYSRAE